MASKLTSIFEDFVAKVARELSCSYLGLLGLKLLLVLGRLLFGYTLLRHLFQQGLLGCPSFSGRLFSF